MSEFRKAKQSCGGHAWGIGQVSSGATGAKPEGLGGTDGHPAVNNAGFRALAVDYESGSGSDHFKYGGTTWGPVIGFSLKW